MTKYFAFTFLLIICIYGETTSGQNSGVKTAVEKNWKTLDQVSYSLQYPSDWELDQSKQMGTSFIIYSPLESPKDKFRENVNLLIQDLKGKNIDLDQYTEISEGQIKSMISNSKLIESKRIKNGTGEYHQIIFLGDQGEFHFKFEQYYRINHDSAYVLTFTCEQDKFESFRETGEKILNSFKLK